MLSKMDGLSLFKLPGTKLPSASQTLMLLLLLASTVQAEEKPTVEELSSDFAWAKGFVWGIVVVFALTGVAVACVAKYENDKSKNKKTVEDADFPAKRADVNFSNIHGYEHITKRLREIIKCHQIKNSFYMLNNPAPRVLLLSGPPGNGKTFLAKAFAGETQRNLVQLNASNATTKWAGSAQEKISRAFAAAKKHSPSVLFIDEFDSIAGSREGLGQESTSDIRNVTLLLQEIDEINTCKDCDVILVVATNHVDKLDKAILSRSKNGTITIDNPKKAEREHIIRGFMNSYQCTESIDSKILAEQTAEFSVRDIGTMFSTAVQILIDPAKNEAPTLTMVALEEAITRIRMGEVNRQLTPSDREHSARHEAGHAIIHFYTDTPRVLEKISILPRGNNGGYNSFIPKEDITFISKRQMYNMIMVFMGSVVAETLDGEDKITTGVTQDLEEAMKIAKQMVSIGFYPKQNKPHFYSTDAKEIANYSDAKKQDLEEKAAAYLDKALAEARQIFDEHREQWKALTEALLERGTLTGNEAKAVIDSVSVRLSFK